MGLSSGTLLKQRHLTYPEEDQKNRAKFREEGQNCLTLKLSQVITALELIHIEQPRSSHLAAGGWQIPGMAAVELGS